MPGHPRLCCQEKEDVDARHRRQAYQSAQGRLLWPGMTRAFRVEIAGAQQIAGVRMAPVPHHQSPGPSVALPQGAGSGSRVQPALRCCCDCAVFTRADELVRMRRDFLTATSLAANAFMTTNLVQSLRLEPLANFEPFRESFAAACR